MPSESIRPCAGVLADKRPGRVDRPTRSAVVAHAELRVRSIEVPGFIVRGLCQRADLDGSRIERFRLALRGGPVDQYATDRSGGGGYRANASNGLRWVRRAISASSSPA